MSCWDALVPLGWMVPVVPGTQHVSVGGAIASDVHGKNHGVAGTFGSHVAAIGLLTAAGSVLELTPQDDGFAATLGGMGLTGVIVWARIRLTPVSSPFLAVDTDRVRDLEHALEALRAPGGPHRVAWLDLLGPRPGRGIVTRAEHLAGDAVPVGARGGATIASRATVPSRWPQALLRPDDGPGLQRAPFPHGSGARAWAGRGDRAPHVPARRARRVAASVRPGWFGAVPTGGSVRGGGDARRR